MLNKHTHYHTTKSTQNTTLNYHQSSPHNKHFPFVKRTAFFSVFSCVFYTVFLCVFFNIYIHLILIIIIIITIILWESFPARVVCCPAVVSGGKQEIVKIFTDRQMMASWQVLEAVSEAKRCWGMFWKKNNGRTAMVQGDILPLG